MIRTNRQGTVEEGPEPWMADQPGELKLQGRGPVRKHGLRLHTGPLWCTTCVFRILLISIERQIGIGLYLEGLEILLDLTTII